MHSNQWKTSVLVLFMILLLSGALSARVYGEVDGDFSLPFLLTSAGQGTGSKMLRVLLNLEGTFEYGKDYYLEDEPEERLMEIESGKYRTLVAVIGISDKGLAASGISLKEEIENLEKLIDEAEENGVGIVTVYLENYKKSTEELYSNNNMIIDLLCPESEWIFYRKGSSLKKQFDDIGKQHGIGVSRFDSVNDFVGILTDIFN